MTSSDPRSNQELVSGTALPRTAVPPGIVDPVASARAELKAALAAIEVRGNFPRRIEKASQRGIVRARTFARRNPVAAAGAVAGVAAAVGGLVWVIARAVAR
ncbi:hypothetical protein FM104_10470 [Microbacterium esteraromaticum]|uniref:DUF3618 domain-containing protein n=1 Tax=Microbacterium esteraromaticum TaxID=57043 RepID=A0A1R4K5B2_9MICO|nr:hypothetical protein [Microbacterium esteraromaticum]SJN39372.1 hypothetical protein FM104_10470 [Microbacterium esteraromaticum]